VASSSTDGLGTYSALPQWPDEMASEDVDNRASTGASTTMPAGTDVKSENVHVDHADDIALIEVPSPSSPEPADLLTRTRTDGSAADNRLIYKVYRRRWFGLAQLVLLNIVVSWDVCISIQPPSVPPPFPQVNMSL
jgi:hypothetical protein